MIKSKIQYPRYNSTKLYKLGFDKQLNQKYQCKKYKRQLVLYYSNEKPKKDSPKCPKYNYDIYSHHKHKHYNGYRSNNRKRKHIIAQHHTANIDSSFMCQTNKIIIYYSDSLFL